MAVSVHGLILSFIFYFHKKWKTKYGSFFVFRFYEESEKRVTLIDKDYFMTMFTSIVYTLFKSKFVSSPLTFSAIQWSRGQQGSAVQKQLMYFNVYISGCCFHISFFHTANCDIKHISRSSHHEVFSECRCKSH